MLGGPHGCRHSTQGKRFCRIDQAGDAQSRSLPARSRLVGHAAGKLVATTDDVNAPTPSFVLAAALTHTREQEQAAQDRGAAIDYEAVMGPNLASFCAAAGLPAAPNALSDAGYMFTLSGADLIRDLYAYCSDLGERMGDAAQVKPGYAIKLALRLFLLDIATGNDAASKDNTCA